MELLSNRLNKLGLITTDEAWQLCRSEFQYGTIAMHFKMIMTEKMNNQEADHLGKGKWFIYRQTKAS